MKVDLSGVPETLLWTLYHRAAEARRPDSVIDDPLAIELVDRIDYPFEERFGRAGLGQWQALRASCFDDEVRRFLGSNPGGTVVALGEGLETQLWRVDNGEAQWVSVDVPEVIELRRKLLPEVDRNRLLAGSAIDGDWREAVDPGSSVLVTAQGLLMYFKAEEVHRLIAACAEWLSGGELVFDAIPSWLAKRSRRQELKTATGYLPPPWHWGIDPAEERGLRELSPRITGLRRLHLPRGRGLLHGALLPIAGRTPGLREGLLSVFRLDAR